MAFEWSPVSSDLYHFQLDQWRLKLEVVSAASGRFWPITTSTVARGSGKQEKLVEKEDVQQKRE